ncbi:MAG: 6-hydroxymethylpterin diphosphokinase MptE-like protein [Polyangiales bacterium]
MDKRGPWPFARFSDVARLLAETAPAPASLVEGHARTLCIEGRQLTSAYDRDAEATLQASHIDMNAREVTVYGVALGDLPRVLLARPMLAHLRVVMLDVAVVAASLAYGFDQGWARDRRVEVVLGAHEHALRLPYAVAPAAVALADASAAHLRDVLLRAPVAPHRGDPPGASEPMTKAAVRANAAMLARDPDVSALFGTQPERRVLVAGEGPALSDTGDFIRAARADGALLIATTAALRPLAAQGIRPDFAVAIDPWPLLRAHFTGLPTRHLAATPLVYAPSVHPTVVRAWKGPRYAACVGRDPRQSLFCEGNVTHAAVDLAVRLGAREVVLLGLDRTPTVHLRAHGRPSPLARGTTWN